MCHLLPVKEEDVDGMPMDNGEEKTAKGAFVPSKWESIDKTELEAQGMAVNISCQILLLSK